MKKYQIGVIRSSKEGSAAFVMAAVNSPKQLAKLIAYILERRPDEFGLVTDPDGFIKVKELLKALHEEPGWKHVRRGHLDEILITLADPPFELSENRIRANRRQHLPKLNQASELPKLLFTCVRQKAYPHVSAKGIYPTTYPQVILSSRRDLAERMGRRFDPRPILLTVQVQQSNEKGVAYYQAGESLFLADFIPPDCFHGPPLPKEKPLGKKADHPPGPGEPKMPGSYFIDLDGKKKAKSPTNPREKIQTDRETDRKGLKKQKRRRERPPWRR
jgi:putative RNA 2'-phosphotransferase